MGVPEDGGFVVVGVRVERGAERGVVLAVADAAAAAADRTGRTGRAVVDGAEAGGGEGGEDAGVGGDAFRDALAAAQAGGDQVEGVAAVDLRAGRAAGGAAVVAADQEVTGREAGGVEAVEDVADLAGAAVDVVFGAVAVEAVSVTHADTRITWTLRPVLFVPLAHRQGIELPACAFEAATSLSDDA